MSSISVNSNFVIEEELKFQIERILLENSMLFDDKSRSRFQKKINNFTAKNHIVVFRSVNEISIYRVSSENKYWKYRVKRNLLTLDFLDDFEFLDGCCE